MPCFITIANIDSKDVGEVREGNERVIRPRLADAQFFWDQDCSQPLDAFCKGLENVLFQKKLGSLADKSLRVRQLTGSIATALGANTALAQRAASLAKCDLMSEMVKEFPSLQGVMGRYYTAKAGESPAVAIAMEEQYWPRHAGDALPSSPIGQSLAIAERLDTIVGIFSLGQAPTGNKDPFAIRRAALGVLRIMIECELNLDLSNLLQMAAKALNGRLSAPLPTLVFDFMMERLRTYYGDQGVSPSVFEAVLTQRPTCPYDFDRRVRAINTFRGLAEAESLIAANKRIANILKNTRLQSNDEFDTALLQEPAERALGQQLMALEHDLAPVFARHDYQHALAKLADLRVLVDQFFDQVLVMTDNTKLKNNRLVLLRRMRALFLRVADISYLQA